MSAHRGRSPDPFLYCSGCLACNSSVCEDNPPLPPTLARREGSMVEPASSCSSSDHLKTGDTKSQSYPQRPASATPYTHRWKHFLNISYSSLVSPEPPAEDNVFTASSLARRGTERFYIRATRHEFILRGFPTSALHFLSLRQQPLPVVSF